MPWGVQGGRRACNIGLESVGIVLLENAFAEVDFALRNRHALVRSGDEARCKVAARPEYVGRTALPDEVEEA